MSACNDYAVELKGVTFKRGERSIFDNVDIAIPRGKVTAIMGPSGCGKTTLLRLIAAQLMPARGEVWVAGNNLPSLSRSELFDMRKQMGVLFQSGALFTDLDVFENVAFPLRVHTRLPDEMIRDIVLMKLQAVGLRGAIELMPDELSGGMKRRVALARAIALDPQILMYDEPFAGQDPIAMGVLVRLIRLLNDALGITSIVVSHDLAETASIADYIYVVGDAQVLGQGTPAELMESDNPRIRQFMKGSADGPVPFHFPAPAYADDLLGGAALDTDGIPVPRPRFRLNVTVPVLTLLGGSEEPGMLEGTIPIPPAMARELAGRVAGIDGVEDVCGSLTEADDVRRAVAGADAVVHLAAKVSISGPESEYRAINIGGTENVLDALRANGGGILVNVSTPSAAHLGRAIVGLDATPADPERARGPYARTKAAAELLAMDADGNDGISVTSIRPHIVWGPGDTQLVGRIVDRAASGRLPVCSRSAMIAARRSRSNGSASSTTPTLRGNNASSMATISR